MKSVWINGERAGEFLALLGNTDIPQVWFVQDGPNRGEVGFTAWYNCVILPDGEKP